MLYFCFFPCSFGPVAHPLLRYYSDIYVPNNKGADKVECAWVDGNGDVRTTGIQVHWPDYSAGSGHSGD